MSQWSRIRGWFGRQKARLPGWILFVLPILWNVFTEVPDVFDAARFWVDAVKNMGGMIGWVATIVDSPWFSIGLILLGLSWLHFVDKPRYVVWDPALPYVGWAFVVIVFFAFWSVLIAGYASSRVAQDLQQKVAALEQQTVPRRLMEDQRKNLANALKEISSKEGFGERPHRLIFEVVFGCNECRVFAGDIIGVWKGSGGWDVQSTNNLSINPLLSGVIVGTDSAQCPFAEAKLVSDALRAGGIDHSMGKLDDEQRKKLSIPDGFCSVVIANKP